jgi:hypothetical protein
MHRLAYTPVVADELRVIYRHKVSLRVEVLIYRIAAGTEDLVEKVLGV